MQIIVNGESVEVVDGITVAKLLNQLQISRERVAVEVNLDIVPKASYEDHPLLLGDRVEIVQFVGGGSNSRSRL